MSAATYKWGDPVFVHIGQSKFPGFIIQPGETPVVSWNEEPGVYCSGYMRLDRISPRVVEPRPRTWRLPEVGDTIRVTDKFCQSHGRELLITKVSWNAAYPIHAGGGVYDLSAIELVRLHDDPTPEEPAAKDPWSGPCDPIGDLKRQMSRDKEARATNPFAEPINGDHVAGAGKVIEEPKQSLVGRIVVIKGPDSSPWKGWMGKVDSVLDNGLCYVLEMLNGATSWPEIDKCEVLPINAADHWESLTDAMKTGIAWGISGKLTTLAEHKAKRQASEGETVDHPRHYNTHPSGIECIEIARHFNFNIGNVIKYVWRCDEKNAPIEDLKKALWYLNDEIQRREKQHQ